MSSKKVTVTLEESLVQALATVSKADNKPVSRIVSEAIEQQMRVRAGQELIREWQAEHGAFTAEELAAARAEMAAADAEALSRGMTAAA